MREGKIQQGTEVLLSFLYIHEKRQDKTRQGIIQQNQSESEGLLQGNILWLIVKYLDYNCICASKDRE